MAFSYGIILFPFKMLLPVSFLKNLEGKWFSKDIFYVLSCYLILLFEVEGIEALRSSFKSSKLFKKHVFNYSFLKFLN